MKELLWISPFAPYDKVTHAGGKVHNYYIKYFHNSKKFNITLLSLCFRDEEKLLDLDRYGIRNNVYVKGHSKIENFIMRAENALSYYNPIDKYAGICLSYERKKIRKLLKEYIASGKKPEIVILQWTFSLMFIPLLKQSFPNCKIIAIEEDVTFQSYERKWKVADHIIIQKFWKHRYKKLKKLELHFLDQSELVITNNPKDTELLINNNIKQEKIFTSIPYFDNYSNIERNADMNKILFFGAMSRPENYKSAIWFIDKVMPLLKIPQLQFIVIGSNPPQVLKDKASDNVKILGYIEDVSEYFSTCLCLAAPLQLGAGIKIKILEALSAGVPVLTNDIGIEGIGAVDRKEYINCKSPQDYAEAVRALRRNFNVTQQLSENSRRFIKEQYQITDRLEKLINKIDYEL